MSWFYDPNHRLTKYNAMEYELHVVQKANIRLAHRMVRGMGSLISEEVNMLDIDLIADLMDGAMFTDCTVGLELSAQGVGLYERQ